MDDLALTPEASDLVPQLDDNEAVEQAFIDDAQKEEKELAAVSSMKGWQKIAKKMQDDIDSLRTGSGINVTPDMPYELIGQKYLVASLAAAHLQSYLDMVNRAVEAVATHERQRNSK